MHLLEQERETLTNFLPQLDEALAKIPLLEMEKPEGPALSELRKCGGIGLLIPSQYGGLEVSLIQAIQIQRAIASRSPSLAVATTMHHTTVSIIAHLATQQSNFKLLKDIVRQNLYVSSGFSEGRTDMNALHPYMQVKKTSDGIIISGSKKPCSLARTMDLLTVSVLVPSQSGDINELAIAVVPAKTPGVEWRPFWSSWVLTGAESDEVILKEVTIPEELIFRLGEPKQLSNILVYGYALFQILISASYLGIASALLERTILAGKGTPTERVRLGIEVEGAMATLEGVAHAMMLQKQSDEELLAKSLFVRYGVQQAIERATSSAVELLGGMAFVSSPEIAYLCASAHALKLHPPSRVSISPALDEYLKGGSLLV